MTPLNALTRRDFLKLISMGVTSLSLSGCVSSLEESSVSGKRPNILFIMSDDHAAPAISAYRGFLSGITKTPNLDRIAKEGMKTQGEFSHETNPITMTDKNGNVVGEATGGEYILNPTQAKAISKESKYFRSLLKKKQFKG